ncbi:MAG: D-sedoheptulose 7-phosphate isomerase [Syntrophobacteraceae bacterium]|jgi:D-sedoheptulose 7-phosphate isomerase
MLTSSPDGYLAMVDAIFSESISVKREAQKLCAKVIVEMAETVASAFQNERRLFLFGNGGSAADAQHIAAEFVNRFQIERRPLPAIALTVDTSILTAVSNDFHFNDIFLKQLQALARPGDVALGISTSGRSPNVLKALEWAHEYRVRTLGLVGTDRTEMDSCCDSIIHVPSGITARIQECHITIGHIMCALVDEILFG